MHWGTYGPTTATYLPPELAMRRFSAAVGDIQRAARGFWRELSTLLTDYADPTVTDITVGGIYLADKFSSAAQLMISNRSGEIETAIGSLVSGLDVLYKLEKALQQII